MGIEPRENHVIPLGEDRFRISWTLEEVLEGLAGAINARAGVTATCAIKDGQLQVTIALPWSKAGYVDSQTKAFIGATEQRVEEGLGLDPAHDKSIE